MPEKRDPPDEAVVEVRRGPGGRAAQRPEDGHQPGGGAGAPYCEAAEGEAARELDQRPSRRAVRREAGQFEVYFYILDAVALREATSKQLA